MFVGHVVTVELKAHYIRMYAHSNVWLLHGTRRRHDVTNPSGQSPRCGDQWYHV